MRSKPIGGRLKGTLKPVFYQEERCGEIREFSDVLLIFRLKALKPEMYRDNVKIDQNIRPNGVLEVKKEPFDWEAYHRLFAQFAAGELPGTHGHPEFAHSVASDGEPEG